MSGYLDLHVDLIKGGMAKYGMVNPMFKTSPVEPHYSDYLVFEESLSMNLKANNITWMYTLPIVARV